MPQDNLRHCLSPTYDKPRPHRHPIGCTASSLMVSLEQQLNKPMCTETNLVFLSSVAAEAWRPVWPWMPPELLLSLNTRL